MPKDKSAVGARHARVCEGEDLTCVERKFELQDRKCKWEEYKGSRYSDGDSALVVELWLHRVADDVSGLTFQEWDPSAGSDDTNLRWQCSSTRASCAPRTSPSRK